jgi:[acyl-carrier-protein] S-malonyltransferase
VYDFGNTTEGRTPVAQRAILFPGQGKGNASQVEIFELSLTSYYSRIESGRYPATSMVAGLSLGEFAALVAAGVLYHETGRNLVQIRQSLMEEAVKENPGMMIAILGLRKGKIEKICSSVRGRKIGLVVVANYNAKLQQVISGEIQAVEQAAAIAREQGAKAVRLKVSGAFHSPLMESANEKFAEHLEAAEFRPVMIPFYSGVDHQRINDSERIRHTLTRQMTSPVDWQRTIEQMILDGATGFFEMEPAGVLTPLVDQIRRDM